MTESYWQSDVTEQVDIPVARPRLPCAEEIASYLRLIDQSRWYSNGGPLVCEFEERLARHFDRRSAHVAAVANATIGLAVALLACELPQNSLCMVPAWTFAASAHAIQLAGLVPWLVDADAMSWALESDAARERLSRAPGEVSAVMPVSPFGAPINYEAWETFREETGLAVVIDAAAAFDTVRATALPTVVSLHATKLLGIGEGGFVLTTDDDFIQEVKKRTNFGFWTSREARVRSINGKMSEYSAAVGLAALKSWLKIRADFARVACAYRDKFENASKAVLQPGFGDDWVTSTVTVQTPNTSADVVVANLTANRVGSRRWWGGGLHRHAAFSSLPREETPNTDSLADHVTGLPCWADLSGEQIEQVCDVVLSVTSPTPASGRVLEIHRR